MVASTASTPVSSINLIRYNDLLEFDNESDGSRRQLLVDIVGNAFGKEGLGILAVTEIPDFERRRLALLPLAAVLPSLPDIDKCVDPVSLYSRGWSHGKEELTPGQPDVAKGSFYVNPITDHLVESLTARDGRAEHWKALAQKYPSFYGDNLWPESLPALKEAVKDMGEMIIKVGQLLAGVCDEFCRQQGVSTNLKAALTKSLNHKGRLLHYFPRSDVISSSTEHDLWCGWHNDHGKALRWQLRTICCVVCLMHEISRYCRFPVGSLTGLVPAIYMNTEGKIVKCPDEAAGLYIQTRSGEVVKAQLPQHALGFQIGETSQIQSGGKLQATPHAVRPSQQPGISRESFALFLEPEFDDPLEIPPGKTMDDCQESGTPLPPTVQPLKARWRPGQSFGDFHVATCSAFTT